MKKTFAMTFAVATCAGAAFAFPFQAYDASAQLNVDGFQNQGLRGDPTGDSFFYVPGIGNTTGFAIAGTFGNAVAGSSTVIGNGLAQAPVTVDSTIIDNGGGNFDIILRMSTTAADLAPAGFTVGGVAADRLGVFLGASAGGDPFNFSDDAFTNSATIELLNNGVNAAGPFDIASFANFTAGPNGSWNGGFGVNFGAGSAGIGINEIVFRGNFTVVPAPSALALVGLGGLVAGRRRR